jgi:hypothetical protein
MSTTSSTLIFMTVCRRALKGYSSVIGVACVAQSLNHLHMEQQLHWSKNRGQKYRKQSFMTVKPALVIIKS